MDKDKDTNSTTVMADVFAQLRQAQTRRAVRLGLLLALPSFGAILGMIFSILAGVPHPTLGLIFLVVGLWACLLVFACWLASLPVWEVGARGLLSPRRKRSAHLMLFIGVFFSTVIAMALVPSPEMFIAFVKSIVTLTGGFLLALYGIEAVQRIAGRSFA